MIWIRADGGKEMGTGHIMRCLSVAAALRQMGEQVCFLVADDSPVPLLEAGGQSYRILSSSYRNLEQELPILLPILRETPQSLFLADSYFVTAEYLRRVRELMPVCYMDDRGISALPVDLLINYNIFAERALYGEGTDRNREGDRKNGEEPCKTAYLLGTEYVPLRQEFQKAGVPVKEKAERVLITTGGSDRYDLAGQILRQALQDPEIEDLEYCVVSGIYNQYLPQLLELERCNKNVHVFSNVSNMAGLMQSCDIAVSAGGSTMYELCAAGVPILCFSFVDNQEKIVEGFARRKLVSFAGNYLSQGEQMIRILTEHIALLRNSVELRRSYSEKERELVDGRGASRIASHLCDLLSGHRAAGSVGSPLRGAEPPLRGAKPPLW